MPVRNIDEMIQLLESNNSESIKHNHGVIGELTMDHGNNVWNIKCRRNIYQRRVDDHFAENEADGFRYHYTGTEFF